MKKIKKLTQSDMEIGRHYMIAWSSDHLSWREFRIMVALNDVGFIANPVSGYDSPVEIYFYYEACSILNSDIDSIAVRLCVWLYLVHRYRNEGWVGHYLDSVSPVYDEYVDLIKRKGAWNEEDNVS